MKSDRYFMRTSLGSKSQSVLCCCYTNDGVVLHVEHHDYLDSDLDDPSSSWADRELDFPDKLDGIMDLPEDMLIKVCHWNSPNHMVGLLERPPDGLCQLDSWGHTAVLVQEVWFGTGCSYHDDLEVRVSRSPHSHDNTTWRIPGVTRAKRGS